MNAKVQLSDKFDLECERVFITGTQALVRLTLMQAERDRLQGLRTAGYVTGYRGSPLGAVDQQFLAARDLLEPYNIVVEPALNEDLAATAIWGTQQAEMRGEGAYDGVFGLWYGKGPGVDRSGDVLRHGNLAGSSPHGGVLVIMGDDHTCESSTTAHQSEYALMDAHIPILSPVNVQEMLDLGLHGWALSRFAGTWCGFKCVKDNVESSASVATDIHRVQPLIPEDFTLPEGGLNIRPMDMPAVQEARLHQFKMDAVRAYARANRLDRIENDGGDNATIGIVASGKSWMDTLQALEELGIDAAAARHIGLRLYKVAMPWPLEPEGAREFAAGLQHIIVVEEKRGLIESQLKSILYGRADAPGIVGKQDESGQVMLQVEGALNPVQIASVIGARLPQERLDDRLRARYQALAASLQSEREQLEVARKPYFCAGCPHNSSTVIPEGARGYAGIGCHWMVQFMDRATEGYTHMGGEGANWIGESHFSTRKHVFQNLGDGTYNHSGLMAVRAAIAAGTNITFKLLYNDAVAMTGGQNHEGTLSPYVIAQELLAAGVRKLVMVSDRPQLLQRDRLPGHVDIVHRNQLQQTQRLLAREPGVTALIYEQTCAAEKRRRRKRGTLEDPPQRIFINPAVCEGCGDCGVQSNCVAIMPLPTELGRKRRIDQSSCNKDFSCVNGFCPSFVTVSGAELLRPPVSSDVLPDVAEPVQQCRLDAPYAIALTGVGGTGVVTVGALLGMAAHLEGRGCGIIDMAGLAQKGGAVVSHIKLAERPEDIKAIRIATGGTDLLLGCDMLVSNADAVMATLDRQRSHVVTNANPLMPGDFVSDPDFDLPETRMRELLVAAVGEDKTTFVAATEIATGLLGDSIAANLFMLGVAYQKGLIPLTSAAILRAIELNGVAVEFNRKAFHWGRAWVDDADAVVWQVQKSDVVSGAAPAAALLAPRAGDGASAPWCADDTTALSLTTLISRRAAHVAAYQNGRWATRYRKLVATMEKAERRHGRDGVDELPLTRAVAVTAARLMTYKDEYEVARLYTDGEFERALRQTFSRSADITLHLAPPLLARPDAATGRPRKREYSARMLTMMRWLAPLRRLRGTPFDVFGYSRERRMERTLIRQYRADVKALIARLGELDADMHTQALELLLLPQSIRGFGPVKLRNAARAAKTRRLLLETLGLENRHDMAWLQHPVADQKPGGAGAGSAGNGDGDVAVMHYVPTSPAASRTAAQTADTTTTSS